jgi:hypothetical protein
VKVRSYRRVLNLACVSALLALALMVWSLVEPTPMPVLVAMSVGQVLGTLSLAAFLAIVAVDVRRAHLERELKSSAPGPSKG